MDSGELMKWPEPSLVTEECEEMENETSLDTTVVKLFGWIFFFPPSTLYVGHITLYLLTTKSVLIIKMKQG